jgi:threonine dehydratase
VTHSSGNHGQALAWAAHKNGLNCAVVVPKTAPSVKLEAIRAYGAQLVPCEPTMEDRRVAEKF